MKDLCFQPRWNNRDEVYPPSRNKQKWVKHMNQYFSKHWTQDIQGQWPTISFTVVPGYSVSRPQNPEGNLGGNKWIP